MARFSEQLRDWLARAEIMARGAEGRRYDAARALEAGRPWHARYEALRILGQLPKSPVALALWADAAEAMYLDHEIVEALSRLGEAVPFRADVWLRLAEARQRLSMDADAALERAADAAEPAEAADRARLLLADRDLERGDPLRAERWLDQLSLVTRASNDAKYRRLETWLYLGALDQARAALPSLPEPALLDGRAWLLHARLLETSDTERAALAYRRALLLEAPGASEHAAEFVANAGEAAPAAALRAVAESLGVADEPLWKAAFATAEGHPDRALQALAEGAQSEPRLAERFVQAALDVDRPAALREAVLLARRHQCPLSPAVEALDRALGLERDDEALAALDDATGTAETFADRRRQELYARWLATGQAANWSLLLRELATLATSLAAVEALRDIEALAVDLERPLRVAIVGEFNAGKSSFINALLGEAIAPVGVLPTTATENHLVWAPDRFVRIERVAGSNEPDRTVAPADLARILASLDASSVARVTIYAPLQLLRRIELIDTPGFNAPDALHHERARTGLEHAHVAIWLLDASQPLKESERRILTKMKELEIPFLILLNKADRLATTGDRNAIERALDYVEKGLASAGLAAISPPITLSARWALAARTAGDERLLLQSNWALLEQLIERELVSRSSALREGALRRQAGAIVEKLVARVSERSNQRREQAFRLDEQRRRLRDARAELDVRATNVRALLLEELDGALSVLKQELRPLAGLGADPAAQPFISNRSRRVLGPRLGERLAAELRLAGESAEGARLAIVELSEAVCVAAAPSLLAKSDSEQQTVHYREHIVGLLCEEARRILEQTLTRSEPAPTPAAERRVVALSNVFRRLRSA